MVRQKLTLGDQLRYSGFACLVALVFSIVEPITYTHSDSVMRAAALLIGSAANIVFLYGFVLLGRAYGRPYIVWAYVCGIIITVIGTTTTLSHLATIFVPSAEVHIVSIIAGVLNVWAGFTLLGLRDRFGTLIFVVGVMNVVWGAGLALLAIHNQMDATLSAPIGVLALVVGLLTWALNIAEAAFFFRAARLST